MHLRWVELRRSRRRIAFVLSHKFYLGPARASRASDPYPTRARSARHSPLARVTGRFRKLNRACHVAGDLFLGGQTKVWTDPDPPQCLWAIRPCSRLKKDGFVESERRSTAMRRETVRVSLDEEAVSRRKPAAPVCHLRLPFPPLPFSMRNVEYSSLIHPTPGSS